MRVVSGRVGVRRGRRRTAGARRRVGVRGLRRRGASVGSRGGGVVGRRSRGAVGGRGPVARSVGGRCCWTRGAAASTGRCVVLARRPGTLWGVRRGSLRRGRPRLSVWLVLLRRVARVRAGTAARGLCRRPSRRGPSRRRPVSRLGRRGTTAGHGSPHGGPRGSCWHRCRCRRGSRHGRPGCSCSSSRWSRAVSGGGGPGGLEVVRVLVREVNMGYGRGLEDDRLLEGLLGWK